MNEQLLQFIWQFQYFNKTHLTTVDGNELTIISQGKLNSNQGPDFCEAKIKIDNTTWIGNIELHVLSSDWNAHKHTGDANYSNIILHVVWNNDVQLKDVNNNAIQTLQLQSLVSKIMLQHYQQLMQAQNFVACEDHLPVLSEIGWVAWKERLVAERLERKAKQMLELLEQANNHWEELFWWLLAKNFGMKVNADAFEQIAKSITLNILAKHKNQLHQLEALLLGQAGLLNGDFNEDYPKLLQREYKFLLAKYKLTPINKSPDFLRMRPANFPTVRLAQLAALVFKSSHLFSKILEIESVNQLKDLFNVAANDYWHYHYSFDEATDFKEKNLGKTMIDNIVINTVVPLLFAYGSYHKHQIIKDRSLTYLLNLSAESNNVTKNWQAKNVSNKTAFDSQALLELKNNYCNEKLCLHCAVGNKLLRS